MPVTINLPVTVDVSGYGVELFGETVTLSGDLITVKTPLSLTSFYQNDANAYLYYIQDATENSFDVYTKATNNGSVVTAFMTSLNIIAGTSYDRTKRGSDNLQATGAFSGIDASSSHFHSLQDFIIGYFAWKVLGHPGAVAAISNDSTLRAAATAQFTATANTLLGANILPATLPLDSLVQQNGAATYATAGAPGAITMANFRTIVEQMMAQDITRFDHQERNKLNAVQWVAGDKVRMQLRFNSNTYSVSQSLSQASTPSATVVPAATIVGAPRRQIASPNDFYVLEFTMA
jgi:hypothetical protein